MSTIAYGSDRCLMLKGKINGINKIIYLFSAVDADDVDDCVDNFIRQQSEKSNNMFGIVGIAKYISDMSCIIRNTTKMPVDFFIDTEKYKHITQQITHQSNNLLHINKMNFTNLKYYDFVDKMNEYINALSFEKKQAKINYAIQYAINEPNNIDNQMNFTNLSNSDLLDKMNKYNRTIVNRIGRTSRNVYNELHNMYPDTQNEMISIVKYLFGEGGLDDGAVHVLDDNMKHMLDDIKKSDKKVFNFFKSNTMELFKTFSLKTNKKKTKTIYQISKLYDLIEKMYNNIINIKPLDTLLRSNHVSIMYVNNYNTLCYTFLLIKQFGFNISHMSDIFINNTMVSTLKEHKNVDKNKLTLAIPINELNDKIRKDDNMDNLNDYLFSDDAYHFVDVSNMSV